jgi:hypothetical protein
MSVDEALGLLAVSGDVTKDALKRAYLRGVRAHSPERDPDGFQRVREAYELLSSIAVLREVQSAPLQDEPLRMPASAGRPPAAQSDAAPPASQKLLPARFTDQRAHVGVAMEVEDWGTASEVLLSFYGGARRPEARLPDPEDTLKVVLELYRAGRPKRAAKLLDAFDTFTQENGHWAGSVGPQGAVRWTLLRELRELSDIVTPELEVTIADAIAENDLDGLTQEFIDWGEAGGSLTRLSEAAPTLYAAVVGQAIERIKTRRKVAWWTWAWRAAILVIVMYRCAPDSVAPPYTVSTPAPPTPMYTPPIAADPQVQEERPAAPPSPAPTPQDPKTRLLESIAKGDCREVSEFFALWSADMDTDSRSVARKHAVTMCPELEGALP